MPHPLRLPSLLLVAVTLAAGCAAPPRGAQLDPAALRGQPLADVIAAHHLDQVHSWPVMNLPPGPNAGTTYFLADGDLVLWFTGRPAVVRAAEFRPSPKPSAQRFEEANAGWSEWVKAHSP